MKRIIILTAWITLLFNYGYLGYMLTDSNIEFPWYLPFITGGANFIVMIYLSIAANNKTWRTVILAISGLIWAFPPLLITFFGIPFLIIYVIFSVQLLMNGQIKTEINAR